MNNSYKIKIMKRKHSRLVLIIVLLISCEKEKTPLPTELPPITEEGKNTFGCVIENEVYVPEIRRTSWSIPGSQFDAIEFTFPVYPDYNFRVSTIRLVDKDDALMDAQVEFMIDSSVNNIGRYNFSHVTVKYENEYYYSDTSNKGELIVSKYDSVNKIIAGTFIFSAIDKNNTNSKIININEGRFDLK